MKTPEAKTRVARHAAQAACVALLLAAAPVAIAGRFSSRGQHPGSAPHASAPHAWAPVQPRSQSGGQAGRQGQRQPQPQPANPYRYGRPSANIQPRPQPNGAGQPAQSARPAYNSPYSVHANPQAAGHLPQWMAQHQNLPVGQQERLLRQEPGFSRLPPAEQARQIQQLHTLNEMPEAQRQRRLARAEAIERLSPADRIQVNQSMRTLDAMSPDRQALVRRAFQDLRGVPIDQRDTMLNSARYNATFSPQERGVLSNLLKVEPYQAPQ